MVKDAIIERDGKVLRLINGPLGLPSGTVIYYQDGLIGRLDGPAIERCDGSVEYWEFGNRMEAHAKRDQSLPLFSA
jgi:hypothetical protein